MAGNWGEWTQWSTECSVTCGEGVFFRLRDCDNPEPMNGGADCTAGEPLETRPCTATRACPGPNGKLINPSQDRFKRDAAGGNHFRTSTTHNLQQFLTLNCAVMYSTAADLFGGFFSCGRRLDSLGRIRPLFLHLRW